MTPQPQRQHRVLIVDDNRAIHADFRKILCPAATASPAMRTLEAELFGGGAETAACDGFELDSAYQGQEALALVEQAVREARPYALAFVDVRMPPGWDGIETIGEIWKCCPDLQVVLCTAYSDYSWDDLQAKLGRTDRLLILKKPFDNVEVLQLAHTLAEKWSLQLQARARVNNLETEVTNRTTALLQTNERLTREVEEHKRTEAALRESQAMVLRQERLAAVGQLSAGVAHDFNNIVTVIQGYADLILMSHGCQPEWLPAVQEISAAAVRAGALTQQLLAFSRKQVMSCRRVDLAELTTNLTGMLSRALGERVSLKVDCAPKLPPVHADSAMLEQVLMNLAVNARDAMPNGGELRIEVAVLEVGPERAKEFPEALPGQFVCVTTSDTGCGMDEGTLKKIFEPFFTTKEVGQGTGLGLATVYGIVKQHQGWVEVESTLGAGSVFRVFLPVAAADAKPSKNGAVTSGTARGRGEIILLVEDEPTVRHLVKRLCVRSGYCVLEAVSGDEALQVFEQAGGRVDLVLTDLVMPGELSGKDLADRLQSRNPAMKVIFTSGYSRDAERDFLQEGVNFLRKPYQPSALAEILQRRLEGN